MIVIWHLYVTETIDKCPGVFRLVKNEGKVSGNVSVLGELEMTAETFGENQKVLRVA